MAGAEARAAWALAVVPGEVGPASGGRLCPHLRPPLVVPTGRTPTSSDQVFHSRSPSQLQSQGKTMTPMSRLPSQSSKNDRVTESNETARRTQSQPGFPTLSQGPGRPVSLPEPPPRHPAMGTSQGDPGTEQTTQPWPPAPRRAPVLPLLKGYSMPPPRQASGRREGKRGGPTQPWLADTGSGGDCGPRVNTASQGGEEEVA